MCRTNLSRLLSLALCLVAVLTASAQQALNVEYWFDRDRTTTLQSSVHDGTVELDVSALSDGLHTLHVMAMGQTPSSVHCYSFVKVSAPDENARLTCICSIDGNPYKQESISMSGGKVNWLLDVEALPQGLHHMRLQVVTPEGAATSVRDAFFWRVLTATEFADMRCFYALDDEEFALLPGDIQSSGNSHFEADVTAASNGLHRITFMLTDGRGNTTGTQTRYFVKIPLGGNGINGYTYWLNEDYEHRVSKTVSPQQESFSLVTMLPFAKQPIRSEDFALVIENGVPTIYARNTLHLRFLEASGRFADMSRTFVDQTVKRTVNNITLLQPGQTKSAARPAENEILWYKVDAQRGDSITFKADRACTIKIFSPNGDLLTTASGDKSVNWCGAHATVDGTYYIAQHDMTATQGNTLSITYRHIDKYAVLSYDAHTVGNGGMSTITIDGNGFFDLYDMVLVDANNDTIHQMSLNRMSNSHLEVTYEFSGVPLGIYDAILRFVDGELRMDDFLTVETPKDIDLELSVDYPSAFLRGRPVTYTVKITNHGNMTAYALPIDLRLYVKNRDNISKVRFNGENLAITIPRELLVDSGHADLARYLGDYIEEQGDRCQFIFGHDHVLNRDYGVCPIIMDIPPCGSRYFTVTINSSSSVSLEATISSDWLPMTVVEGTSGVRFKGPKREWMCCYKDRIECVADIIAAYAGLITSPAAGCATSLTLEGLEMAFDVWCSEGNSAMERWQNYLKSQRKSLIASLMSTLMDCLLGPYDDIDDIALIIDLKGMLDSGVLYAECEEAENNLEENPNCPPNPDKDGGESTLIWPRDPNEMLGYVAPSGDKHIGNGKTDVFYTICFENDSSALAPASNILLTDTIDGGLHNLNSFMPTHIKIGDVTAELNGGPNSVQTVDLRPNTNCIAQVECNYDNLTGIVQFALSSLDPMTMEPVTDADQGMLPPNLFGDRGQGEVSFNVSLMDGLPEGTEIRNRAAIKFDNEAVIMTPDWVNVIDGVAPECHIDGCELVNDSTATVTIQAWDDRSGPWRYDVYAQYGEGGEWYLAARSVPADSAAMVRVYEGIDHGFYALLTDSAGNMEQKMPLREYSLDYFAPSANSELTLSLATGWNWMSHNLNMSLAVTALQPNAYRIVGQDGETIKDPRYGYTGTITALEPTQLYKVQMTNAASVPLSGKLYNAAFKSTDLTSGWNWLGYPLAGAMSPGEALIRLNAQDGDCIVGQEGMSMYSNGQWSGTLTQLRPGQGYMLKLQSDAILRWNSSRASIRQNLPQPVQGGDEVPFSVDSHRYPNVMAMVAELYDNGSPVDPDHYWLVANCGDECRGVAQTVDGHLMMNIYGSGGETITFSAVNRNTGHTEAIAETRLFVSEVEGTLQQPVPLHIGTSELCDVALDGLHVYPTMTDGDVNVMATDGVIEAIYVINTKGQVVMTQSNCGGHAVVSLSDQPDGVYLIRVMTANGVSTTRVVKRK